MRPLVVRLAGRIAIGIMLRVGLEPIRLTARCGGTGLVRGTSVHAERCRCHRGEPEEQEGTDRSTKRVLVMHHPPI